MITRAINQALKHSSKFYIWFSLPSLRLTAHLKQEVMVSSVLVIVKIKIKNGFFEKPSSNSRSDRSLSISDRIVNININGQTTTFCRRSYLCSIFRNYHPLLGIFKLLSDDGPTGCVLSFPQGGFLSYWERICIATAVCTKVMCQRILILVRFFFFFSINLLEFPWRPKLSCFSFLLLLLKIESLKDLTLFFFNGQVKSEIRKVWSTTYLYCLSLWCLKWLYGGSFAFTLHSWNLFTHLFLEMCKNLDFEYVFEHIKYRS